MATATTDTYVPCHSEQTLYLSKPGHVAAYVCWMCAQVHKINFIITPYLPLPSQKSQTPNSVL